MNEDLPGKQFWIELAHHAFSIIIECVKEQLAHQKRMLDEAKSIADAESDYKLTEETKENEQASEEVHENEHDSVGSSKSILYESLVHSFKLCEDEISRMELESLSKHYNRPIRTTYNLLKR
jgi:hypothetical protein